MKQAIGEYFCAFNTSKLFEVVGAVFGISGALVMSFVPEQAFIAWLLWTVSSTFLSGFAINAKLPFLLALQGVFLVINLSGVYNTFPNI